MLFTNEIKIKQKKQKENNKPNGLIILDITYNSYLAYALLGHLGSLTWNKYPT